MDFDGCFLHFHFTPLETIRFENDGGRSEEHTSELQSQSNLVCRLLLEKKKNACPLRNGTLASDKTFGFGLALASLDHLRISFTDVYIHLHDTPVANTLLLKLVFASRIL